MNLAVSSTFSAPAMAATTLSLVDLPPNRITTIISLREAEDGDAQSQVLQRLSELGFMPGETISVLQRGPGGREPIAVQVGDTVFALRRHEASCIQVKA
ncbi:MAG: FeoA family protein [Pseudomonadota bacterium]|nr:FeoA family protein [Polaromonas sp.]